MLTKLWSIKNINICLASGMWAGTGTEPNFTHKLYSSVLGNFSCTQKPIKAELLMLAGTGAGSGRCWAHPRPALSPAGATVTSKFTGSDLIQPPSVYLCLQTLPSTVLDFCPFTLVHVELVTLLKIPFLNTQTDCFQYFLYLKELTISLTIKCPEENAIELGGVETGSMNA